MRKVIAIFGMPRSGTSFLGQVIDSCPEVAYRLEPLFSYKLKNMVDENSSKQEFNAFFNEAFNAKDDHFMNQFEKRKQGSYPIFNDKKPLYLGFKTTRFHNILPAMLDHFKNDDLKVVSLVRHPSACISSWIHHPNEFPKDADFRKEWRTGSCRKTAKEEFWGFDDWKKVMNLHISLEKNFKNFKIFQYEKIIHNIEEEVENIFKFLSIPYTNQTQSFLFEAQSKNMTDPYAVYKDKSVTLKWKDQLDIKIQNIIENELKDSVLNRFLIEI